MAQPNEFIQQRDVTYPTGGVAPAAPAPLLNSGVTSSGVSDQTVPQSQTSVSIPSGNSNPQGTYISELSFEAFTPLFLAFAFWFISLYLWNESARFQKWLVKDDEHAPDPQSGFGAIASWTIVVGLSAFLRWAPTNPPEAEDGPYPLLFLFSILRSPKIYVPLIFMLGVVPAAVAICKFLLAIPLAQTAARTADGSSVIKRSPLTAAVGATIGAINLAGSSVTLWLWLSSLPR